MRIAASLAWPILILCERHRFARRFSIGEAHCPHVQIVSSASTGPYLVLLPTADMGAP